MALIDSAFEGAPGDVGVLLYRIAVTRNGQTDTISGVRTTTMPGVTSDGKVYFLGYKHISNIVDDAEIYDPLTRAITTFELPDSVDGSAHDMSISPDARHIAYITLSPDGKTESGVVRTWPNGRLVGETPPEPFFEDDVDYDGIRWLSSDRVEFAYRSGRSTATWIHAVLTLGRPEIAVDSLHSQPGWAR